MRGKKGTAAIAPELVCEGCAAPFRPRSYRPILAGTYRYCSPGCGGATQSRSVEGRALLSASASRRTGPKHPRWEPDRAMVRARRQMQWATYKMIRRCLARGTERVGDSTETLGYDRAALMAHLEKQFTEGMAWSNYGRSGWEIDHIRPLCTFPLGTPAREINALSNLRPLWGVDNARRGRKSY